MMRARLNLILAMGIDDGDDLAHGNETCTPYPYLRYDSGPSRSKANVQRKFSK